MNPSISIHRLRLLFAVFTAERGKAYLIAFGLIILICLLLMLPILFKDGFHDLLFVLHALALFGPVMLGGGLFTSTVFSHYHQPNQGVSAIMLPASQVEKYLIVLITNILFVLGTLLIFWNLHLWFSELANATIPVGSRRYNPIPGYAAEYLFYFYLLTQGIMFLGSIYFSKQAFLRSLIVVLGVGLAAMLLHLGLAYQLTGATSQINSLPFMNWELVRTGQGYAVEYPKHIAVAIRWLVALVAVGLMLTAYVRMKEKEI